MDQDTTKNGPGGNDRGNWRERLAAGKELPKISEEFSTGDSQGEPEQQPATSSAPEAPPPAAEQTRPRTPVTRPAPMAPRVPRPGPQGAAGAPESPGSRSGEARQPGFMPSSSSGAARQPLKPGGAASANPASRPSWPASSRSEAGSSSASRPSFPRVGLSSGQSQASSTRPPAAGNDAFGERLRAQREAAERLAQQRLAAARQRSAQSSGQGKPAIERRPDSNTAAPPRQNLAQPTPKAKPHAPGADMPRFTFAEEEIAAAQREGATPGEAAATGGRDQPNVPPPYTPPSAYEGSAAASPAPHAAPGREIDYDWHAGQPGADHAHPAAGSGSEPSARAPGGPYAVRPRDYAYDDEAIFDAEHPGSQSVPPRASAADYSAAYRGFEDDFEPDSPPRRGAGPLILLLSLLVLAMIGGGAIYWYQQQSQGTAATQTDDIPVVNAPADPVKATPEPEEQPQEAAAPVRRKQIYDRILGEETLEPERLVPTEEQPQFRQIQQPQPEQGVPAQNPDQGFDTGGQNDQTDPRPLPLPPPPGTGEQGDLLLPERSRPVTTAASPVRGPELRSGTEPSRADGLIAPVAQPTSSSAARQADLQMPAPTRPAERGSALVRAGREDGAQRQPVAPEAVALNRDDESEPAARESAPVAMTRGAAAAPTPARAEAAPPSRGAVAMPPRGEAGNSGGPTPQPRVSQADVETAAAEPTPQAAFGGQSGARGLSIETAKPEATAADDATEMATAREAATQDVASDVADGTEAVAEEQGFAPPLPRVKPEPPAPVQSARTTEPRAEPQRQAPRRPSGPVRITPTLLAPDAGTSQAAPQVTQPSAPAPARRTMGRERDPLAEWRDSSADRPASASQQTASQPAPQPAPKQQVASAEPAPNQPVAESTAGGYVVQLAAFRSEGEAESEFQRLAQSHPQLVGNLSPRVQRASLGQGGSFYRLGIGPVGDRNAATKLCNALIAAGEKDCLVRRL